MIKLKMSSKPTTSNIDNNYNTMTQSLISSIPLDNQFNSSIQDYQQNNGPMDEELYTVITNGDDCDNARAIEDVEELMEAKLSNGKEIEFSPKNGRKFSPDKIKGINKFMDCLRVKNLFSI